IHARSRSPSVAQSVRKSNRGQVRPVSIRRITFFVHDLAANPIVRAAALAAAVRRRYDVEIIGFLHSGPDVYEPYRGLFPCKTIQLPLDTWLVAKAIPALAALATGDVLYACKPLL